MLFVNLWFFLGKTHKNGLPTSVFILLFNIRSLFYQKDSCPRSSSYPVEQHRTRIITETDAGRKLNYTNCVWLLTNLLQNFCRVRRRPDFQAGLCDPFIVHLISCFVHKFSHTIFANRRCFTFENIIMLNICPEGIRFYPRPSLRKINEFPKD